MSGYVEVLVLRALVLRVMLDASRKRAGMLAAQDREVMACELRECVLLVQAARGGF